jgi:hypothetical protein
VADKVRLEPHLTAVTVRRRRRLWRMTCGQPVIPPCPCLCPSPPTAIPLAAMAGAHA